MERIELGTPDLTQENVQKLGELFPQVLTEVQDENGQVQRAVDFDALRDLLGDVAEGTRERYQFTWPGKREAKAEARRPIEKTMRPCPEESVNWDTTENLYIEGDNLDALKILKETYAGKVKMIYIDPPYNTGHDFVYDDDFAVANAEHLEESGQLDERGKLVTNLESNGRFHSDWCSMMYPRLMLARDLLSADGVIFASVDDCEARNLKSICDEIFGESNFVAQLIWKSKSGGANDSRFFAVDHEYVLVYAKCAESFSLLLDPEAEASTLYGYRDDKGDYSLERLDKQNLGYHASLDFPIIGPDGREYRVQHKNPKEKAARWRWSKERVSERFDELVFKFPYVYTKNYRKEGGVARSLLTDERFGRTRSGKKDCQDLMGGDYFSNPKPSRLIRFFETVVLDSESIVLDFFSGSGTTAQATYENNALRSVKARCILVQYPEVVEEKQNAAKAGYANICEIGKERIRRAGAKIKAEVEEANRQLKLGEEPKKVPDIGFRVLKIDSSNFADVMATPDATSQQMLLDFSDNLKDGRSDMDILFEVLPKFQIPYSAKIEELYICGKRCFNVDNGMLIACFDKNVDTDTIEAIAKMQPLYAVMRDASMANDATHANFEELFKTYSPDTIRRVI